MTEFPLDENDIEGYVEIGWYLDLLIVGNDLLVGSLERRKSYHCSDKCSDPQTNRVGPHLEATGPPPMSRNIYSIVVFGLSNLVP